MGWKLPNIHGAPCIDATSQTTPRQIPVLALWPSHPESYTFTNYVSEPLHTKYNQNVFSFTSGHTLEELSPCIQWMKSFAHVTMEKGPATLRSFEQVPREDAHNIQTHAVELASLVSKVFVVS